VSAGASAELDRLIAAMGQDRRARELLASEDEPGRVLDALRSLEGEAGAALSAYLDLIGYRLLDGFDISEPCALEFVRKSREFEPDIVHIFRTTFSDGSGACRNAIFSGDEETHSRRQVWPREWSMLSMSFCECDPDLTALGSRLSI
jgi:hypothetical protein